MITMGMPALAYRFYFLTQSLRSPERNVLGFAGIRPIRESLFGMVDAAAPETHERWPERMDSQGRRGR